MGALERLEDVSLRSRTPARPLPCCPGGPMLELLRQCLEQKSKVREGHGQRSSRVELSQHTHLASAVRRDTSVSYLERLRPRYCGV